MKKLILFLAIMLPLAVLAQKSPVDKLFEKYANKEGFTTVNISGKLLGFASKVDSSDPTTSEMLSNLTGIRILSVEDSEITGKLDFYEELSKDGFFDNNEFEVLMEVTESDEVVRFLAKDAGNGKFSDLILVVGGDDSALISISGIIDPENIGKITKAVDIDLDGTNQF
ncbi:protein of unknown function [Tangfeifania diversioriginum]|uniref:DUF4252 domain-containing protein n=1 Tax=Tangfeifania diversioriginum TaxID=1168035 RepID=A0A1M6D153_9BACT|nr:DUF4252 domain-containing protein [Tangfeifania diversioriginum]SHI66831.1 protein of unknown function [Tangfeifania diversioriginum]